MRNTNKILVLTLTALLLVATSCIPIHTRGGRKISNKIEGQAGRLLHPYSISIDANYDPRLDSILPGYKLLPVVIRNVSMRTIIMDANEDKWIIVNENGKRYRAINTLRTQDRKMWRRLPKKMRTIIDYPEVLPLNYSVTFDLLFPKSARLDYFREIRFTSVGLGKTFILSKEY